MMGNLKIGIISMSEHVKTHVRSLERAGHKVYLLGPRPKVIPPSLDLIVYRPSGVSHKAADRLRADNPSQPIIFSDSLSEIVEQVERYARTGTLKTIDSAIDNKGDEVVTQENQEPVRGKHVRAYYKKRENRWDLRSGPQKETYQGRVTTRAEAIARVAELDAQFEAAEAALQDQTEAVDLEPEPVVELPVAGGEPQLPVVAVGEPQQDELNAILQMLQEQLGKMGLSEFNDLEVTGLSVKVYRRHLNGPDGLACGQDLKGPFASSLGGVTCMSCRESNLFKTIEWALGSGLKV